MCEAIWFDSLSIVCFVIVIVIWGALTVRSPPPTLLYAGLLECVRATAKEESPNSTPQWCNFITVSYGLL